ncbi:hypothetical protein B0H21DRAFT_834001 [Amylocystis lapponica]|nr:hypothetical protein B0H21DRAFT_834001 [Amylocystis lapponica]
MSPLRTQTWTSGIIKEARETTTTTSQFHQFCMLHDVSGSVYTPFWTDFPHTDIHLAITPDVLHQLYQGVFKHIVNWCERTMSSNELDCRIRCLPPAYGVRHFKNGISALSQISGTERKNMAKILLGCLVGILPKQGILACRGLLDFIYISQYSTHDDSTLKYLQDALDLFHQNKEYFIHTHMRDHFNIPKFHSLLHYVQSIKLLGTTDNYNTEMFERLHIDFAKEGWRASNQRDEFPQMTRWLSRQEKMTSFKSYITWMDTQKTSNLPPASPPPHKGMPNTISLSKSPTHSGKLIRDIEQQHHAPGLSARLKEYLNTLLPNPTSSRSALQHVLPFDCLDIFHSFKFHPAEITDDQQQRDTIKAAPANSKGSSRFDTVVVLHGESAESTGLSGTRIGRVRVIFKLPVSLGQGMGQTPPNWLQKPLAYVEWYTNLKSTADPTHNIPSNQYPSELYAHP